jgi:NTP pyrophosphatase (non-canonical NTP hydrolase)
MRQITDAPLSITDAQREAHDNAKTKGFWDYAKGEKYGSPFLIEQIVKGSIPEKLALIHSEVSEALECYREGHLVTSVREDGKPEGFASELADVIIRVFDLAGALDIDLEHEIALKMQHNATRPHKHGKVC